LDWIEHIKSNENQALSEIYSSYRAPCLSWLKSTYKVDTEDGIEIFQLSVIILYDNITKGKLTELKGDIKTYLFAIAKNKARELQRKNAKEIRQGEFTVPLKSYIIDEEIEEKIQLESRIDSTYKALQILGDPCKSVLQLFYYKQLSMQAICDLMGYKNADTVKNQKYKCIKRLQSIYKEHKLQSHTLG